MSIDVNRIYKLTLDQTYDLIRAVGKEVTVLVRGHMGSGKSSMLNRFRLDYPEHKCFYFDCTTKMDAGDVMLPQFKELDSFGCVRYITNEELGVHLQQPVIIMVDELDKNEAIVRALLRLLLERKMGCYTLHPDSIVFATANLSNEGVSAAFDPHQTNRLIVVESQKPTAQQWLEGFAIPNNLHPAVMGFVKDNPQVFQSFEDVKDPEHNQYIFHPQSTRDKFITHRSLHAASKLLYQQQHLDRHTLTCALIGTIGARGALDLMAFVELASGMPTLDSIKKSPESAKVPTSAAAACMTVYRTLSTLDTSWVEAWMMYCKRLDTEAMALFVNGVNSEKYDKERKRAVMCNKGFTQWALENNHLFGV